MEKFIKVLISLTIAMSTFAVLGVSQAAYYNRDAFFSGNGLPDSSIGDLVYWESEGIAYMGYTMMCLDARTEYDKIENAVINFRRATSSEVNNSKLRFWAEDYGDTFWYGYMTPYDVNGNPLSQEGTAWSKADLQLNDGKMDRKGLVDAERRKVVTHELGHVLSLKHQPLGTSSVMQDDRNTYWWPTPLDISNLQYMY